MQTSFLIKNLNTTEFPTPVGFIVVPSYPFIVSERKRLMEVFETSQRDYFNSGCNSAIEGVVWDHEVVGLNPATPTTQEMLMCKASSQCSLDDK